MRAGELLGRTAYDVDGRRLGRVVDIVVEPGGAYDRLRITALVVAPHWYGRLVNEERGALPGPWLVAWVGRLLGHGSRTVPVSRVRLLPPLPGFPVDTG